MLLAALLLLAAPQPFLEMSAGPMALRQTGRSGVGSGPLVRLDLGYELTQWAAPEVWLTGAMESAPLGAPGDQALLGAGVGGRLLFARLGPDGNVGLWLHGGAGWGAPVAGAGAHGPTAFAGALVSFQPFVKRFSLGLEADGLAFRNAYGIALLPSLRCAF